ncbi:hypothetical protein SESBI_31217 [Sesbania bispinosa]|nr:hypothetical protein SESBI_31217 [Sesbania bispinosa]
MPTEPLRQLSSSSPSFSSYSSETFAQIAARVIHELRNDSNSLNDTHFDSWQQNDDVVDDDFEFSFLSTDPISSPVSADDIFENGQIRPTYPLFDRTLLNDVALVSPINAETAPRPRRLPLRKLMFETEDENGNELDGVDAETYCVWTPSCKKSSSTGSTTSKRWKLRDLLHRSHSDGKKDKLAGNGGSGAAKDGKRKLFLPQELVGLFNRKS